MSKKRREHDFGITHRGGDRWEITIELDRDYGAGDLQGAGRNRIYRTVRAKNRTEARRKGRLIYEKIKQGYSGDISKVTVETHLREYLDTTAKLGANPATVEEYKRIAERYIYGNIGKHELTKLTPAILQRFVSDLSERGKVGQLLKNGKRSKSAGKPLSARTVRHVIRVLSPSLDQAVAHRTIPSNPAKYIKLPKPKKPDRIPLTNSEIIKLEELIRTIPDRTLAAALAIGLYAGTRISEAVGLQWQDVILEDRGGIFINKAMTRQADGGYALGDTKSEESVREIPIPLSLVDFLIEHKAKQDEYLDSLGFTQTARTPVVLNLDGTTQPRPDVLGDKASSLFRKNDFTEKLTFHNLRHTYASQLIAAGVELFTVSKLLGHSSIQITADHYGHLVEGQGEAAIEKFESALVKIREQEKPV